MAGDSGTGGPREVHVPALPDCLMTSCDARGRGGLEQTVSDDISRAGRASSDLRRS